ncbi:MAG: MTAP family purine nucleoside phosphorylase [Chloroflexota bacterium]
MRFGIIGGTAVYGVEGVETKEEIIDTQYGQAKVYLGQGKDQDIVFLTRHGADHSIPPHKVNYRANIAALKKLDVEKVMATYCVGSLITMIPPGGMVLLDQFIDTTMHRESTFFQGGEYGLGHTDMTEPYCGTLRDVIYQLAKERKFELLPNGTYVSTNGPRFETSAEVRMYAGLGGHVVGMTGGTETALAREAGLHFSAVAFSINYGAGLKYSELTVDKTGLDKTLPELMQLFIEALRAPFKQTCNCDQAIHYSENPKINLFA